MPSKAKLTNAAVAAKISALPNIPQEMNDQFVRSLMGVEVVNEAPIAFKKALIECLMAPNRDGGQKPADMKKALADHS